MHCPDEGSRYVKKTPEYKSLMKTFQNFAFSSGSPLSINGGDNMKIRMHCGYCNRHNKNKVGGPDRHASVYCLTLLVSDGKSKRVGGRKWCAVTKVKEVVFREILGSILSGIHLGFTSTLRTIPGNQITNFIHRLIPH